MPILERLMRVVASISLVIVFVALGFFACASPATTPLVANVTSNDSSSVFTRTQLVQVASATRDYAFGSHDLASLYQSIYELDQAYKQSLQDTSGKTPAAFPSVDTSIDASNLSLSELTQAFSNASDSYCYTSEEIAHLDDCYLVSRGAIIALILAITLAVISLMFTALRGKRRACGSVAMAAGVATQAVFILLIAWALFDFTSLFANFHSLFFSEGTWAFSANSLLICALPEAFWMAMAFVWLVVSVILSVVSFIIGKALRKA